MITIQKVTSNVQSVPREGQGETRLTLRPPVIPNSNYVIMAGDWNSLKHRIFECFLYCKRQVHRDFLITLYNFFFKTFISTRHFSKIRRSKIPLQSVQCQLLYPMQMDMQPDNYRINIQIPQFFSRRFRKPWQRWQPFWNHTWLNLRYVAINSISGCMVAVKTDW